jgi:uncharacterized damage-inducible protein DinB
MKIIAEKLIEELKSQTHEFISFSETLKHKSVDELNWKSNPTSWSVLECLEHLNLYGDFYIPEIRKVIKESKTKEERVFKSGFIGEYFASSMLPKEKLNKMKTFKDKNPLNSNLSLETIHRFVKQQNEFLELLEKAKAVNLNKVKTSITLTKLIKLKLGDTLRFIVNHNIRHFEQIKDVLRSQLN